MERLALRAGGSFTDMEDRRQTDPLLIALDQRFTDFLDRYERDQIRARESRDEIIGRLKPMERFFETVKPWHSRFLWVFSLIILGSIAYWVKWFWDHTKWN